MLSSIKYLILVLSPLKLKLRPLTFGIPNLKAWGLPFFAYLSINGPPGYARPISFADLSNASPAASSNVSPSSSKFK